jgi:MFS transporter, OFA family, oxalate/formate antiporter
MSKKVAEEKRWLIALAGALLMLCLGTVYAWSYFQTPLMEKYGWNNAQVSLIFSIAIFFLGLAAAVGGVWLPKLGPRKLALSGSILFGLGYLLSAAALALRSLPLLYLGYGAIGGMGLGLCYVTPVATVSKWFPDKKGSATGIIIMGFGLGALFMSKLLAPALLSLAGGDLITVFALLGGIFFLITFGASLVLRNPRAETVAARPDERPNQLLDGAKQRPIITSVFSMKFILDRKSVV